ncbi:limbic system-associated membrane protein-like isoform X2 [Macrosteles quadrilineatus]|uniref:limbic system-associated membrane protein-like isoform X2 n=1 Tax=Macrosteles quadrilineatus TaxID=74068 RepID=UPI0023E2F226|nr:limbic system-associated membrane protein-like isoform X2 [Macrosteles quadrilineatus]
MGYDTSLLLIAFSLVYGVGTDPPKFVTKSDTHHTVEGETIILPCAVDHLGSYVLLWRRGSTVLTADKLMIVRDPRFSLHDGFSLKIANITAKDAGEYLCQIADSPAKDQVHSVQVLVPPSIHTTLPNGQLVSRKGGTVTLSCTASGNPMPSIIWHRQGSPLLHNEGFSITIERVDRHHAGLYQCTANNGVGPPVTVDLQLDVLHAPEIEVERCRVQTAEGRNEVLVCTVFGNPTPNMVWIRDGSIVTSSNRYSLDKNGNRHSLSIINIQSSDFGNFTCAAENSLGKTKENIHITGKPGRAKVVSSPYSYSVNSYNLTAVVESVSSIMEVRFIYRRILINDSHQQLGTWQEVSFSPQARSGPPQHFVWYHLQSLQPASVFQVHIQARNRYGWGDLSDVYQFYTRGVDDDFFERNLELLSSSSTSFQAFQRILLMTCLLLRSAL